MWKSTSASGAPDNSSLSHFSAMTRQCWPRRAVRNQHRHAIEQASRRWRGGRRYDAARNFDFHTDGHLAHLRRLLVEIFHGLGSSGQPAPPAATRLPPSGALDLDDSDFSGGFCGRIAFVPHVSLGDAPRRPRRSHATVRCKLAFLEGLYSASAGTAQKSASPRVSKLPFARRVSEQSISSSPAARGKGAITVCG